MPVLNPEIILGERGEDWLDKNFEGKEYDWPGTMELVKCFPVTKPRGYILSLPSSAPEPKEMNKTMNTKPKLIKITLEFDDGHKLVRTKEDVLPFLIRLTKQMNKK